MVQMAIEEVVVVIVMVVMVNVMLVVLVHLSEKVTPDIKA